MNLFFNSPELSNVIVRYTLKLFNFIEISCHFLNSEVFRIKRNSENEKIMLDGHSVTREGTITYSIYSSRRF